MLYISMSFLRIVGQLGTGVLLGFPLKELPFFFMLCFVIQRTVLIMHLKYKTHCSGGVVIYAASIIFNCIGLCKPSDLSASIKSIADGAGTDLHHERSGRSILTTTESIRTTHMRRRQGTRIPNRQALETRFSVSAENGFQDGDLKPQTKDNWPQTKLNRVKNDCLNGRIKNVISGNFYINGRIESNSNVGYPSDPADSAADLHGKTRGLSGMENIWRRLEPVVDCGDDAMTLTVRRRRSVHLLLDRGNGSVLPLSQVPVECGYSVQTTLRDVILRTPYDACHVILEDDRYVLPLLWRGTPARISCPVARAQPSAPGPTYLCCSPDGMTIVLNGPSATKELKVKVRGEWSPFQLLAEQCGYTTENSAGKLLIAAPFVACGITVNEGKYTLSLKVGPKAVTLSCPIAPPEDFHQARESVGGRRRVSASSAETLPQIGQPFLFAPPFYLAPPYYPYPQSGNDPHAEADVRINPSAMPSFTLTTRPPPVESQSIDQYIYHTFPRNLYNDFHVPGSDDSYPNGAYSDSGQRQVTSISNYPEHQEATDSPYIPAGFPVHTQVSFQPPGHSFNPYYHYYHHPKIPVPLLPDPGTAIDSFEGDSESELLRGPHSYQHKVSVAVYPGSFPQPIPEPSKSPSSTNALLPQPLYVPHPYPYFYQHSHIPEGKDKRPTLPEYATGTTMSSTAWPQTVATAVTPWHSLASILQLPVDYKSSNFQPLQPNVYVPFPANPRYFSYYDQYNKVPFSHLQYPISTVENSFAENSQAAPLTEGSPHDAQTVPLHPYYYYSVSSHGVPEHFLFPNHEGGEDWQEDEMREPFNVRTENTPPTASPSVLGPDSSDDCDSSSGCCSHTVKAAECTLGQYFVFSVPDSLKRPTVVPPAHLSENTRDSCTPQRLSSNPDLYAVPLDGCGVHTHVNGQTEVYLLEVHGVHEIKEQHHTMTEGSPVRVMVECRSLPGSQGKVKFRMIGHSSAPPTVAVQLRIATDESFSMYYPEAHLPLSLVYGRPVYLEVGLVNPPEPDLKLLVHYCLAYSDRPGASWMLVYDGCPRHGNSHQKLFLPPPPPPANPLHTHRLIITSFLTLPSHRPSHSDIRDEAHLKSPEIYIVCSTDVCTPRDGECTVGCSSCKF